MLGNLEVLVREAIGITVVHVSNGGFAGYGPGFWGEGHDPYTHEVLGPDDVDMSKAIAQMGLRSERVSDPAEVIPALERALAANEAGQPAYIEFICSQYPVYGQWIRSSHRDMISKIAAAPPRASHSPGGRMNREWSCIGTTCSDPPAHHARVRAALAPRRC